MKRFNLLLISLLFLPLSIFAQEQDSLKSTEEVISDTPAKVVDVEALQQEVDRLNALVKQYSDSVTTLNGQIYEFQQTIKDNNRDIKKLKEHLVFADTIVARLSNDCLRKKYDKVRVDQAIDNFEQMYSPELKSKFGRLKILLNDYGKHTQELVAIFTEAETDKALGNPFTGQKQAMAYIDKIKNTRYYQDVYNDNWTIPYLNKLIDKCFETIRSFNPKESKELHLLDLMN